ncbi:metallophosphoesterase [Luteolibacter arcticus]|uniref:Metallophosphoesterase n=1 Tax=Luteolibacter arcticus TaxID=1581411 RepID=A0ABT3GEW3_9BACT|nr:metallophosphoesterase [Luteolibacter arcticus]MCW1922163.1 metallophosphoesterase [Luteolibacter arcticus]
MKYLGLLHLSDIHCGRANDQLAKAMACVPGILKDPEMAEIEKIVVLLTGDLTFSGSKKEFGEVAVMLKKLRAELGDKYWTTVMVPGNHDCDFSKPQTVRNMVLRQIPSESEPIFQEDLVTTCTAVQDEFFAFMNEFCENAPINDKLRLYWEIRLNDGDVAVTLDCYNTSWTSQLHEKPGTLAFPRSLLKKLGDGKNVDLRVGLLHHPTNWITPMRRRALDSHLERTCDIVVSGHEHLVKASSIQDFSGHITNHIQAGVFHEGPGDTPGEFSLIQVDIEERKFRVIKCRSVSSRDYTEIARPVDIFRPFRRDRSRIAHGYQISPDFEAFISNPGVEFTHPSGRQITLEDIFVMPDFRSVSKASEEDSITFLPGERLHQFIDDNKLVFVSGGELAGKTSVAKKVFVGSLQSGALPIWINGSEITNNTASDVSKLIKNGINRCYLNAEFDEFVQSENSELKVLIIEDFNKSKINLKAKNDLLQELEKNFSSIIVFADPSLSLRELTLTDLELDFRQRYEQIEICEFGPSRRRALAEKWLLLGNEKTISSDQLRQKVEEAEQVFKLLRGDSYFPSLPFFLLSILQIKDSSALRDGVGKYGYHYESLINDALLNSFGKVSEDDRRNYLSLFAYQLFTNKSESLSDQEWELLHRNFQTTYKKSVSKSEIEKIVLGSKLVIQIEGVWKFRYPYVYYFFVARYFRDRLHDGRILEIVESLSSNFHTELATNIWMFLVHQSKNPILLGILIKRAKSLLPQYPEAEMDNDLRFFSKIGQKPDELEAYVIDTPQEKRERLRDDDRNEAINGDGEKSTSIPETDSIFKEIDASLKTVQVLGQMLKNFSYEGDTKIDLVRQGSLLCFRLLGFLLSALEKQHNEFIDFIAKKLAKLNSGTQSYEEARQEVTRNVVRIARMNILGIFRFAAVALGSKDEEEVYDEFTKEVKSNAGDLLAMAIKLESAKLPINEISKLAAKLKNNYIAESTLKLLVIHHCYVFEPKISDLQAVCDSLGLKAKSLETKRTLKALQG